jgi:F-type H+-transporting ATPase subunit b
VSRSKGPLLALSILAFGLGLAATSVAQDPYGDDAAPKPRAAKPAKPAAKPAKPAAAAPTAVPAAAPTAVPAAAPTAAPSAAPAASMNPATGLPNWHPPIGGPTPQPQPPTRPGHDQQQKLRDMVEQLKREKGGAPAEPVEAKGRKYPRDEHGYCIGQGPTDPPKNVNLFHGWLGVDNARAVPPPPRRVEGETGFFAERLGSPAWWKWRLTPNPYRYENHDDECDPRNTPIPLLANLINFAALMFIVTRFGAKPVAEALKKRRDSVMSEIDRARAIKESAEARLAEYEADIQQLDVKLETLQKQYADEAALEEKRLREDLAQARDRLLSDASFRIEQEGKSTRDRLSREALDGALDAAEALLRTSVKGADHDRLCEEFLDQLGTTLAKSDGVSTNGTTSGAST